MHHMTRCTFFVSRFASSSVPVVFIPLAMICLILASCGYPPQTARRTDTYVGPEPPRPNNPFQEACLPELQGQIPTVAGAEFVDDDEMCLQCHEVYATNFQNNVHRGIHKGQSCEACHGPASEHVRTRGKEPGLILNPAKMSPIESAEICLKCHEQNACTPGAQWRSSKHAHRGVSCNACHNAHYNVPAGTPSVNEPGGLANVPKRTPPVVQAGYRMMEDLPSLAGTSQNLGAVAPNVCYKCHADMREMEAIAGPHQVLGCNGFNCTTCHDPHGNLLEHSRKDLCLQCHQTDSPTMAWHSSIHGVADVACTDCHNPHPHTQVEQFANISHTNIKRPKRRVMSVQEPEACYKCHAKIYGLNQLPSHHPIREGKMVCSDCHDPHGQFEGNLKAEKVNYVCYKCHADKAGPFAYEHPPVTEDCSICHEPHGTVANNLLRQPPNFLCLRCHSGHRGGPGFHDSFLLPDFAGGSPAAQRAFYSNCTQCHSQVHGSNIPSPHRPGALMR